MSIISEYGIELIADFEKYVGNAYQDAVGVWTVGYGTTMLNGRKVRRGDYLSEQDARMLMAEEANDFLNNALHSVSVELNQNQLDAIGCFVYNVGVGAFKKSTLLRKLNAEDFEGAADEFLRWNMGGGRVLRGLTRRRQAERELFLTEPEPETKEPQDEEMEYKYMTDMPTLYDNY